MMNIFNVMPMTTEVDVTIYQTLEFGMTSGYRPVCMLEEMPMGADAYGVDVLLNHLFTHSDTLPMTGNARSISMGDVVEIDRGLLGSTFYLLSPQHDAWVTIDRALVC